MTVLIDKRIPLNSVNYSVRAIQAVTQYGVGAMVDFQNQTLLTAAPEYWDSIMKIFDDRFAKSLGVEYFGLPLRVSYTRFPEWYFCPRCRRFQPLKKWIQEYRKKGNKRTVERDPDMVNHIQCITCHQDLVVSRIVTICEKGHINDFPWVEWVHYKSKKPICSNPSLTIKNSGSSEGLEGTVIECTNCHARTTLRGAFNNDAFTKLTGDVDSELFVCPGNQPFNHTKDNCGCYPKAVQRGASSVYFPLVYSSLVIPPYADKINRRIENSRAYEKCVNVLEDEEPDERIGLIKRRLAKWSKEIAEEIGVSEKDVQEVLENKWLHPENDIPDVGSVQYRFDEYKALKGELDINEDNLGDFSKEILPIEDYHLPHIEKITLVDKVRVVNAFVGFSRIEPVSSRESKGFVSSKKKNTRWYPGYEVRGEGIFIEFKNADIETWIEKNPEVKQRAAIIDYNYNHSYLGSRNKKTVSPKFILLHTISHLLIKQLSFECGYSVASLSERIFCSDEKDGMVMSGIFLYTASGDAEGTLGGLVRQGRPDTLPKILKKAIDHARFCSNDPVCIMSRGQGRDGLNLAACHACALLPETSCEESNSFLDRGMVIGTFENSSIGFFNDL